MWLSGFQRCLLSKKHKNLKLLQCDKSPSSLLQRNKFQKSTKCMEYYMSFLFDGVYLCHSEGIYNPHLLLGLEHFV